MGESGGCISHGHLDQVKILLASAGLEEIRAKLETGGSRGPVQ